jgi:hypothetical protein
MDCICLKQIVKGLPEWLAYLFGDSSTIEQVVWNKINQFYYLILFFKTLTLQLFSKTIKTNYSQK